MSLALLDPLIEDLPFALREQIGSYALSVEQALDEIVGGRGLRRSKSLDDAIVLIAGIRKLSALISVTTNMVNVSEVVLAGSDTSAIRSGALELGIGAAFYGKLRALETELSGVLSQLGISDFIDLPYGDIAEVLASSPLKK